MAFRTGFISVAGRTNAGKSTLINHLTGNSISIVTRRAQTTRNTIKSILTTEDCQMIFIDTPGLHTPSSKLGEYMESVTREAIKGTDIILFVVDAIRKRKSSEDREAAQKLAEFRKPIILVLNKTDIVMKELLLPLISFYQKNMSFYAAVPVSSKTGDGLDVLKGEIKKLIPEGPRHYPDDMITDMPEKWIAEEIIREKLLMMLNEEVPHGTAVEVILFKQEDNGKTEIYANIYCEKKTHKGIIIGKNGSMLKKIKAMATQSLKRWLQTRVYLELWVKTKEDWRNSSSMLKILGYQ